MYSQKSGTDPKVANEKFMNANYEEALEDYLTLLDNEPKNEKFNYRVGVCYLNSNINKAKAVPYLEIVTRVTKLEFDSWYLLGRAYQFAYRFDDALKAFNKFKELKKGKAENIADTPRQIQFCYNAKELMKFPVDITFENLGTGVNSEFRDYFPFITIDETFLVYNSKRPEGNEQKNPDGSFEPKIYISKVKDGIFMNGMYMSKLLGNKYSSEEVIGLSPKGDIMLIYAEDVSGNGDIFISYADQSKNFSSAEKLPEAINSPKGSEIAASISADGSTLYFASDRPGGLGGTDLYVCKKLPNGTWGPPVNLGAEINTVMDEDFPNISPDGKSLYFSSNGRTSMGGYDIFRAEWDMATNNWGQGKNLGFPVNTPGDNMNFRISESGRYGYMASLNEKGLGDFDIYRVVFNEVESEYTVFTGNIGVAGSKKLSDYAEVFITVTNTQTQEIYGNYVPNPGSGKYVIILPPGEYELSIDASGYTAAIEKLRVYDKGSFTREIEKNILMNPN